MNKFDCIDKSGIINKIDDNTITIQLLTSEACGTCRIKTFCIKENDFINLKYDNIVDTSFLRSLKNGDKVRLIVSKKHAYKALFYAYLIPTFLIIALLILSINVFHIKDLFAGFFVIFFVILYYVILSLFKNKLKEKIKITIKKYN